MRIDALQVHVKKTWTNETYSKDFNEAAIKHKDFGHALTHIVKAAGKLAAIIEDADHDRDVEDNPGKYLADLVICAARAANTLDMSLQTLVLKRLAEKLPLSREV